MTPSARHTLQPQSPAPSGSPTTLAEVFSPSPSYVVVTNGSSQTNYTYYGLNTDGTPWCVSQQTPVSSSSNLACSLPNGRYKVNFQSGFWTKGHFHVHAKNGTVTKLKIPGVGKIDLDGVSVNNGVITGNFTYNGNPAQVSLTANGNTLFGVVTYYPTSSGDSQTVGVYAAESGGGNEEKPARG